MPSIAAMIISLSCAGASEPRVITVDRDNTEITESCTVTFGDQPVIDADGNGVIHITRDAITVDFAGAHLHGAISDQLPNEFTGIGVRITAKNVTLKNFRISGFKVGIHALNADGLTIHDGDVSNNFHQRLKSTPQAEDAGDWLWPHHNDNNEWMTSYGAGICVQDSHHVTLHNIRARKTQNGILLNRVNHSRVFDCDCSFLSGWGLAMWRSSNNVVSRNAFDFCVRGYSHGVYNRGQDSAGILMFEQCNDNIIAENSATHGGDGFFGFAGKESLGEVNPRDTPDWYVRRGCNDNVIIENDFSFAAAHGLELTFSFGARIIANRFAGNAICGIWAGYSQDSYIRMNFFHRNGDAGYGNEHGGINIEHGRNHLILENTFRENSCGVHLWWDNDQSIFTLPWYRANHDNTALVATVLQNIFTRGPIGIHLRELQGEVITHGNRFDRIDEPIRQQGATGERPVDKSAIEIEPFAAVEALEARMGDTHPRDERRRLAGRQSIIMTEWGPWDHASPLLRLERSLDHAHEYRLLGVKGVPPRDAIHTEGRINLSIEDGIVRVQTEHANALVPYSLTIQTDDTSANARGVLSAGTWNVLAFKSACDPREDVERWRREGEANSHTFAAPSLDFRFGSGGMSESQHLPAGLPRDHFGVIATRSLTIPTGRWRIRTTSDDGIRVWMDDQLVVDDWTWHGPTRHDHDFDVIEPREHTFRVEYFELDGHAVLSVDFENIN